MRNNLRVLFVLLLFGLPLSLIAIGQELIPIVPMPVLFDSGVAQRDVEPTPRDLTPVGRPDAPPGPFMEPGLRTPAPPGPPTQELQRTMQNLQRIVQEAQRTGNPYARELQNAVQELQRAARTVLAQTPPPPPNVVRTPLNAPLNAEREKAYIELARQYFYVFANTPVEVPVVPEAAPAQKEQSPAVDGPAEDEDEAVAALDEVKTPGAVVAEEEESEPEKSEREKVLENFVECVKKISPAAQITLLTELIRVARTNDEFKLLEGLLDTVTQPMAAERAPEVRPPATPPGRPVPGQGLPLAPANRLR